MRRTDDARLWLGGGALVAVLVLVLGWLVLVAPQLSHASTVRAEQADEQVASASLSAKVTTLRKQNAQTPALVADLRKVRGQLPISSGLAAFTDQIGQQAAQARVTVTSVAVAAPVATTGTGSAGGTPTTGGTPATGGTPTTGATTNGATTDTATAAATTATTGPAGKVFAVPVTITTAGSLVKQRAFLSRLQTGPRAVLVSSSRLGPAATTGGATTGARTGATTGGRGTAAAASTDKASEMTTLLTVFVAPQTPADTAELTRQLNAKTVR